MSCEHTRNAGNSVTEGGTGEIDIVSLLKLEAYPRSMWIGRNAVLETGCIMCKAIEEGAKYNS